jgi:hypothetical protein
MVLLRLIEITMSSEIFKMEEFVACSSPLLCDAAPPPRGRLSPLLCAVARRRPLGDSHTRTNTVCVCAPPGAGKRSVQTTPPPGLCEERGEALPFGDGGGDGGGESNAHTARGARPARRRRRRRHNVTATAEQQRRRRAAGDTQALVRCRRTDGRTVGRSVG